MVLQMSFLKKICEESESCLEIYISGRGDFNMDINQEKYLAEGIRLLIKNHFHDSPQEEEWLKKYDEIFPEEGFFGGPIKKEDNTS